jgi:hypothetical protein
VCREPVPNILERASCVYHTNLPAPAPPLPAANLGLKVNTGSYIHVCITGQYNHVNILLFMIMHNIGIDWSEK